MSSLLKGKLYYTEFARREKKSLREPTRCNKDISKVVYIVFNHMNCQITLLYITLLYYIQMSVQ